MMRFVVSKRLRTVVAASAALAGFAPALSASAGDPVAPAANASRPLSPTGQRFVQEWKDRLTKLRDEQAARGPATSVAADLAQRAALDRAARQGVNRLFASDVPADERGWVIRDMFAEIGKMDAENTTFLKAALPAKGWFTASADAPHLPTDAWLLVQHSPDRDLQRDVLLRIEPLLSTGSVQAADYARLFDRVQTASGQAQRYASQAACKSGAWQFDPIEAPSDVDRLRRAIGWDETFEATSVRLKIGTPC